ncbi:MAG TPA: hypothetical protein VEK85_04940 [Gemmatimonadales bacterium]|nr:hypothetical protein [Gemmatimonadales bacterium]
MGRKMLDVMGRKVDLLEKVDVIEHEELKLLGDGVERGVERKERLVFTSPSDWSPEQTEQYLDWRIHLVDAEITKLRQQIEDQSSLRRRWLTVTGGRSKLVGSSNGGSGNGGSGNGGSGNGHEPESSGG